jgi:hypothetical protein
LIQLNELLGNSEEHQVDHQEPSDLDNFEDQDDDISKRSQAAYLRFGRNGPAYLRFGKRAGAYLRFGKRAGAYLRFGKRNPAYLRFGK